MTQEDIQSKLDITERERANLLKWTAQFSPQLIEYMLKKYTRKGDKVLDPFLGSGTVIYEAGRLGLEAHGSELNPAAVYLSRLYLLINKTPQQRKDMLAEAKVLVDFCLNHPADTIPYLDFSQKVQELKELVTDGENIVLGTLIVLVDVKKETDIETAKVVRVWKKLEKTIDELPYSKRKLNVFHSDARNLPLKDSSIDLVITSPPYINVLNYHQQYRHSMELLGWNLLEVAKAEIGANRKNRQNRFLTVISYCQEIAQCLEELKRTTRLEARVIFIVGKQSKVRGVAFENGSIVKRIATECCGLSLVEEQQRKFKNRYGQIIYEDILHFVNTKAAKYSENCLNEALYEIIDEKMKLAIEQDFSDEIIDQLRQVKEKINNLCPSVPFKESDDEITYPTWGQVKSALS
jgi:methylase of polypeptide subunit release factors